MLRPVRYRMVRIPRQNWASAGFSVGTDGSAARPSQLMLPGADRPLPVIECVLKQNGFPLRITNGALQHTHSRFLSRFLSRAGEGDGKSNTALDGTRSAHTKSKFFEITLALLRI